MIEDELKGLYIDGPSWCDPVKPDDFLIAIGKKKSNSVYHVYSVKSKPSPKGPRLIRYNMKVLKSDLITALRRDKDTQQLITVQWY